MGGEPPVAVSPGGKPGDKHHVAAVDVDVGVRLGFLQEWPPLSVLCHCCMAAEAVFLACAPSNSTTGMIGEILFVGMEYLVWRVVLCWL